MKALKIILLAGLYTILPGCNNTNPPHTVWIKVKMQQTPQPRPCNGKPNGTISEQWTKPE